ncbi:class I SAM-dependent methyltransferase [Streptomyces nogalater]|uniref:Class I SAM-dependent methyltransferase n=1 Tax=Streptomyces nogalater TaxID=38314 RepID=A0ABW0WGY8_STRNO
MYGTELTQIYELVHEGRGKDYGAEAEEITRRIRARLPGARTLLDVACGTGAHLRAFATRFEEVEGVELSEAMCAVARRRLPGVALHRADMRDFRLGRTFHAVTCMFGSIGYARTPQELTATLRCFAAHLAPGGVAAVDPWWFPETYLDGYVSGDTMTVDGRTVSRVSHSTREGTASVMRVHYLVADAALGVRHFSESHRISLFSREQYEEAFSRAGFAVEYVPRLHAGRGLFLGVRKSGRAG